MLSCRAPGSGNFELNKGCSIVLPHGTCGHMHLLYMSLPCLVPVRCCARQGQSMQVPAGGSHLSWRTVSDQRAFVWLADVVDWVGAGANESLALLAMGYRHMHGLGVPRSCHAAVLYYNPEAEAVVAAGRRPQGLQPVRKLPLNPPRLLPTHSPSVSRTASPLRRGLLDFGGSVLHMQTAGCTGCIATPPCVLWLLC